MRAVATGIARPAPTRRRTEAAEISAITHDDPRCIYACIAYVDLIDALLRGDEPDAAIAAVAASSPLNPETRDVVATAPHLALSTLPATSWTPSRSASGH
jgi:ADP-ribosylglycohydrolase